MGDKPPKRDQAGAAGTPLQFVVISDPKQTRSADSRRLVRSQAARSSQWRRAGGPGSSTTKAAAEGDEPTTGAESTGRRKRRRPNSPDQLPDHTEEKNAQRDADSSTDQEHKAALAAAMGDAAPGLLTPVSASKLNPFDCASRKISRQEQILLDYHITFSLPRLPEYGPGSWLASADRRRHLHQTVTEWVPLALADPAVLAGFLLTSVRRIAARCPGEPGYEELALQYRGECLRLTARAVADAGRATADETILMVMALMWDDSVQQDYVGFMRHLEAVRRIVELRGGPQNLGCNGFLEMTISLFLSGSSQHCRPPLPPRMTGEGVEISNESPDPGS